MSRSRRLTATGRRLNQQQIQSAEALRHTEDIVEAKVVSNDFNHAVLEVPTSRMDGLRETVTE